LDLALGLMQVPEFTEVSINLTDTSINFSKLTQIAIFGVGGRVGNKSYLQISIF
jgi:hypothetical protein